MTVISPTPADAPPAARPTPNADKARALIAMLEAGGTGTPAPGVAPADLRHWARDLVEAVERRRRAGPAPDAEPGSGPSPLVLTRAMSVAPPASREAPRLFRASAPAFTKEPVLTRRGAPAAGQAEAPTRNALVDAISKANAARMPGARAAAETPPVAPRPAVAADPPRVARSRQTLRRMIDATLDRREMTREHPAIIALSILGKPSMEQANTLRALPGGQARAVHKALRSMEAAAP